MTYLGVEDLTVNATAGGDNVVVAQNAPSTTAVAFHGNGGTDSLIGPNATACSTSPAPTR